jgi:hypothetical protein
VNAVLVEGVGLAGADAVQGLDRQRGKPVRGLAGRDGEDPARLQNLGGAGGRDGDRRADADTDVDPEAGELRTRSISPSRRVSVPW